MAVLSLLLRAICQSSRKLIFQWRLPENFSPLEITQQVFFKFSNLKKQLTVTDKKTFCISNFKEICFYRHLAGQMELGENQEG
jgi:hypothetical protein